MSKSFIPIDGSVLTASRLASMAMAGVLTPLWATPAAAQIGVGEVERMVCTETINPVQLLGMGLGCLSIYFFLKFLLRLVNGVKASDDSSGRGSFTKNVKSSLYSLFAGLLPVFVLVALSVAGIDVSSCLLP